jgi:hypothetical protein
MINDSMCLYSPLLQTHYEILGLKQNCSSKQIRDAFVSISKKVNTFLFIEKEFDDVLQHINRCTQMLTKVTQIATSLFLS